MNTDTSTRRQQRNEAAKTFCAERGYGIAEYAYYEEALALLFAHLIGVPPATAGIPFFKINNARARLDILEALLRKKYGTTYNLFWNSLSKLLKALDGERNQIVHWTTMVTDFDVPVVSLTPPNYWNEDENTRSFLLQDLVNFSDKCTFFKTTLAYFVHSLEGRPFVSCAWREIFQRAVAYPPPIGHPLVPNP